MLGAAWALFKGLTLLKQLGLIGSVVGLLWAGWSWKSNYDEGKREEGRQELIEADARQVAVKKAQGKKMIERDKQLMKDAEKWADESHDLWIQRSLDILKDVGTDVGGGAFR